MSDENPELDLESARLLLIIDGPEQQVRSSRPHLPVSDLPADPWPGLPPEIREGIRWTAEWVERLDGDNAKTSWETLMTQPLLVQAAALKRLRAAGKLDPLCRDWLLKEFSAWVQTHRAVLFGPAMAEGMDSPIWKLVNPDGSAREVSSEQQ